MIYGRIKQHELQLWGIMIKQLIRGKQTPLDQKTIDKLYHYLSKQSNNGHDTNHDPDDCHVCKSMTDSIMPGVDHPIQAIGRMELEIYNLIDWQKFSRNLFEFFGILKEFRVQTPELNLQKHYAFFDVKKAVPASEQIHYKPDGKPFSLAELTTINDFIREQLHIAPSTIEAAMVRSFIIGNILEKLQRDASIIDRTIKMASLPRTLQEAVKKYNLSQREIRSIQFSMARTGEHITKIGESARQTVIKNVIDAQMERKGSSQLAQDLFHEVTDTSSNLNRDWRRVSLFESNASSQAGFLAGCKESEVVVWKAQPNACQLCRQLDGKKFTVRSEAPEDYSQYEPGSKKYKELAKIFDETIWVNKLNIGRSSAKRQRLDSGEYRMREHHELYSPTIPLHPNCRCYWLKERYA